MPTTVALFGAAGKMGTRISEKLRHAPEYRTLYVEAADAGRERLRERGLTATPAEEAVRAADVAVLAVPDTLIRTVAAKAVPALRSGAMLVCLDPAAPHSGELPDRADIVYFVTHPCHPPVINEESTPEGRADCFGGVAHQHVVAALMQGPEDDYARGEALARRMFAPVMNVHRVTVEQMALLEPALAETTTLTFMFAMREALDEVVRRGVPAEAARDFLLGHLHVDIGILFGFIQAQVSDGAKLAARRGMERLLRPDWKQVFEPEEVMKEVRSIAQARQAGGK